MVVARVVVPGHGLEIRSVGLCDSLRVLQSQARLSCEVFMYANTSFENGGCVVHRGVGYWTDFMREERGDEAYVIVMMDDVDARQIDLVRFLGEMKEKMYDLASAAIPGRHHLHMRPNKDCISREVNFVDILFAVFRRWAWECWKSHIDTEMNQMGWGYDITFKKLCKAKVGVLDSQRALHRAPSRVRGRLYNSSTAISQMTTWLKHNHHEKSKGRTLRCHPR